MKKKEIFEALDYILELCVFMGFPIVTLTSILIQSIKGHEVTALWYAALASTYILYYLLETLNASRQRNKILLMILQSVALRGEVICNEDNKR